MEITHEFDRDTVSELLKKRAAYAPRDIAYSFPEWDQHYTWSDMWENAAVLAKGFLRLGVKKGDRIALLMQGRMEMILAMFGAACIGAIVVPLNAYSKKDELQGYLDDSKPELLIIGTEGHGHHYPTLVREMIAESDKERPWIPAHVFVVGREEEAELPFLPFSDLYALAGQIREEEFVEVCAAVRCKDPLILLYTSGTTGRPKGVLRSTSSFLVSDGGYAQQGKPAEWLTRLSDRIIRRFSLMNLLPLYHLGGFASIFTGLKACNIRIVLLSHFNPVSALSAVERERCSILSGTPFMIQHMLALPGREGYNLSSLLGVVFTSSAVNGSLLKNIIHDPQLKLVFFMVSYGSSEAGSVSNGVCFVNRRKNAAWSMLFRLLNYSNLLSGRIDPGEFEDGDCSLGGKVDRGVQVRIVNPETGAVLSCLERGEIQIRSHRVMRYFKENQACCSFTEDGWYRSGDLGFLDNRGHLKITARMKRIISRGGEKICPVEIENVLMNHKDVSAAMVVGIPDELYGELVCACVIGKKGANLTEERLRMEITPHLSAFKIPRYFVFLDDLPLSPTGKLAVPAIQGLALERIGELRKNA
ncbi:class I adenylate-forming enzyme family protein [Paenibacillus rhizophilus]|uniref:Long-chain fatty acid--CoA ligase n=1 Tax=Paenibacillus rhizophilus TaxID=1850366 RepID=A0A3N9P5C6_9BACL|nr:class I adenylate-forming enzyme family protein [Paenibacillus rhizophilus]RQW10620.1 long-chain fatty acid--CoA ligase [Paenibacillus rhizophilus]